MSTKLGISRMGCGLCLPGGLYAICFLLFTFDCAGGDAVRLPGGWQDCRGRRGGKDNRLSRPRAEQAQRTGGDGPRAESREPALRLCGQPTARAAAAPPPHRQRRPAGRGSRVHLYLYFILHKLPWAAVHGYVATIACQEVMVVAVDVGRLRAARLQRGCCRTMSS